MFLGFKSVIDDTETSLSHFYVNKYLFHCLKSFACFIVKQYVKLYNLAFFIVMLVPYLKLCNLDISVPYATQCKPVFVVAFVYVSLSNTLTAGANLVGSHVRLSPSHGYREHGR